MTFFLSCLPFLSFLELIKVPKLNNAEDVFFQLTANLCLVIFINLFEQYSQSDLPPLRPLCGEAPPGQDSNLGRADPVAGTKIQPPPLFAQLCYML